MKLSKEFTSQILRCAIEMEQTGQTETTIQAHKYGPLNVYLDVKPRIVLFKFEIPAESPYLSGKIIYIGGN